LYSDNISLPSSSCHRSLYPRPLHSFPTRRSSDLGPFKRSDVHGACRCAVQAGTALARRAGAPAGGLANSPQGSGILAMFRWHQPERQALSRLFQTDKYWRAANAWRHALGIAAPGSRTSPRARAVPARITAAPARICGVTVSSRNHLPHSTPNTGTRKVTLTAAVGPSLAISLKNTMYAAPVHARASAMVAIQAWPDTGCAGHVAMASGASTSDAAIMLPVALERAATSPS